MSWGFTNSMLAAMTEVSFSQNHISARTHTHTHTHTHTPADVNTVP